MSGSVDMNLENDYFKVCSEFETKISSAVEKYMAAAQIKEAEIEDSEIKEAFIECIMTKNINNIDIESPENLTKVAFLRLVKASKSYYMEKLNNSESDKLTGLQNLARRLKRDYELISGLR